MAEPVIVDASAMVDLLLGSGHSPAIGARLRGCELHAPAHLDAEVLSALGRLERGGHLTARQVASRIRHAMSAPIERHLLTDLLADAWKRRHNLRLVDALYVELATRLGAVIITTDRGLAGASPQAELISGSA